MKRNWTVILGSLIAAFTAASCWFDNEEDLYEYYYQANPCDSLNITYVDHIEPVVRGQCAIPGCHVAGGTGNGIFESYEGLKAKVDNGSLLQRTVIEADMPPSGPLSECQMVQIRVWIEAGAPEN